MLISEPKIPQPRSRGARVSRVLPLMLISEPKIPQPQIAARRANCKRQTDVDQRAENSSTPARRLGRCLDGDQLMLISEPKIPQPPRALLRRALADRADVDQRAENSSTPTAGHQAPV